MAGGSQFAEARLLGHPVPWSGVKGFNYQPSQGTTGYELWRTFDAERIAVELDRGRALFPHVNALRWWLSWDAFERDQNGFAANFELALSVAADRGFAVMPVLFNRWHSPITDYGGVYLDHFLPGVSWLQRRGSGDEQGKPWRPEHGERVFDAFLERIVGGHADDDRIFAWDVCNEPFSYECPLASVPEAVVDAELTWLRHMSEECARLDRSTPRGISVHPLHGGAGLALVEPISDVLLVHPYFDNEDGLLDAYDAIALETGKPLLATEVCWGSLDDERRAQIVRATLSALSSRGIGWLAYVLHHSLVIDAHRPEHGPINPAIGAMHFIEPDGTVRSGHEVVNEFCSPPRELPSADVGGS
jgi:hypothetical protein